MDLTKLAECVRQNPDDITTEVMFLDWFGVSPSYEMSLPKTDRKIAREMLEHAGIFNEWQTDVGSHFGCTHFEMCGLSYNLTIVIFNHHQPCCYRVSLICHPFMKYNKYGDNLVELLVGMLKSEF